MAMALPPDAPRPRLCLIRKRTPEEEYGFNLHAEKTKGQFIGAVDAGSPAEVAGLRPGDRILSVNGNTVQNEPHKHVVAKIKENALGCGLIVVDEDTQSWYTERKLPVPVDPNFTVLGTDVVLKKKEQQLQAINNETDVVDSSSKNHLQDSPSSAAYRPPSYQEATTGVESTTMKPRFCRLIKPDPNAEFGFNLHAEKNCGHFIGKIDSNSIAEVAGLEEGQRIVGVNGVLIYPYTPHKDVVSLIKANPNRTELLVASPDVDKWYKQNAQEFDFANAERYVPSDEHRSGVGEYATTKSNGYMNGDSGITNGDHYEESLSNESKNLRLDSPNGLNEHMNGYNNDRTTTSYIHSRPPPPVEIGYESIRDTSATYPSSNASKQQPDWMNLSAAQLRERVGQHKKPDPRKEQLSLQQKHELIRNM